MEIKEKQIKEIKIIGAENLDPITVYIDEQKDEEYKGQCKKDVRYKGRIVIICYGVALNYYWGAMGEPMKEFFCTASTGYIVDKFEQNARETFKPQAFDGYVDEVGDWHAEETDNVNVTMAEHHRKYIYRIVEAVKKAFRQQLEQRGDYEN